MKKILTSMLVAIVVLFNGLTATAAVTYDESYSAAKKYYSEKTELTSLNEILGYESLGLDASKLPLKDVVKSDYATDIAQSVIALVLHGDDPRNYGGVNYVEMLENCVQSNGAFDKTNLSTTANRQVYGVYALYVVNSSKLRQASDYLITLAESDGGFGFGYGASYPDVSGWVIEILSLIDSKTYETTIKNAIDSLLAVQENNGGFNEGYSTNANTQSCVLVGLLTYDAEGVENGKYNKGSNNPYDFLLGFQNVDGTFWYDIPGSANSYATLQGVIAIGYKYNGSVYIQAKKEYQAIIAKPEEKPTENPSVPEQKEPAKEETIKQPTNQKAGVVQTSDYTDVLIYLVMFLASSFFVIKSKKIFG